MEIYEERESVHIVEPMHEIVTAGGIGGWAMLFEYTDEVVEEITPDLPGRPHALLNVRFWRRKKPYDQALYAQARREVWIQCARFNQKYAAGLKRRKSSYHMKKISLLSIFVLLTCILCSCGIVDQYEYQNMLEESKQNIAPYLEQIPTHPNSEGKIELPSELHKNIDNVDFCGISGSITYKKDKYGVIDKVYWASHDFYTYEEHQEFAKILEDYFGSPAIIDREQYGQWNDVNYYWVDESVPCTVVFYTSVRANHEDEKDRFEVYWDMEKEMPD